RNIAARNLLAASGAIALAGRWTADRSLVAMRPFHALVPLLRFDAEGGDRPGFEPANADRLVGLLAVSVGAIVDPVEGRIDLGDQPASARARSQLNRPL